MTGTIKYLSDKGFGFIGIENEPKDLFFHERDLRYCQYKGLKVGMRVNIDRVEDTPKGKTAREVTVLVA